MSRIRALWDFASELEGDLSFSAGDIMVVVQHSDTGWWKARLERTGQVGMIPANFVEAIASPQMPLPTPKRADSGGARRLSIRSNMQCSAVAVTRATRKQDGGQRRTFYDIVVQTPKGPQTYAKRYSSLVALDKHMQALVPHCCGLVNLLEPELNINKKHIDTVEARRHAMASYLEGLLRDDNAVSLMLTWLVPGQRSELDASGDVVDAGVSASASLSGIMAESDMVSVPVLSPAPKPARNSGPPPPITPRNSLPTFTPLPTAAPAISVSSPAPAPAPTPTPALVAAPSPSPTPAPADDGAVQFTVEHDPAFRPGNTGTFSLDDLDAFDALMENGYAILRQPGQPKSGPTAAAGQSVHVSYLASVWDGVGQKTVQFQKVLKHTFQLGHPSVLPPGLHKVIEQLRVGERAVAVLGPDEGYGRDGLDPWVPELAHIVLDVTLLSATGQPGAKIAAKVEQVSTGTTAEPAPMAPEAITARFASEVSATSSRESFAQYKGRKDRLVLGQEGSKGRSASDAQFTREAAERAMQAMLARENSAGGGKKNSLFDRMFKRGGKEKEKEKERPPLPDAAGIPVFGTQPGIPPPPPATNKRGTSVRLVGTPREAVEFASQQQTQQPPAPPAYTVPPAGAVPPPDVPPAPSADSSQAASAPMPAAAAATPVATAPVAAALAAELGRKLAAVTATATATASSSGNSTAVSSPAPPPVTARSASPAPAAPKATPPSSADSPSTKYGYEALLDMRGRNALPEEIDQTRLECYVIDSDFEAVFGMSPPAFQVMPKWKRDAAKKKAGLF